MRKIAAAVVMIVAITGILAGCGGTKSAEDVVNGVLKQAEEMKSYLAEGSMVLHTGQEPQTYGLEVWYQTPHYYRIALINQKKDITQIVLRNDDGVFVLTPHLKKSFRFQSDWPNNQGQVYLYQTLADSIQQDPERQFVADQESSAYVFDVKANYPNSSLSRQKIWLDQKDYAPHHVEITDDQGQAVVEVHFERFEFNASFDAADFDMQKNLTSWDIRSMTVTADINGDGTDSAEQAAPTFAGVIEPAYIPVGVELLDRQDVKLGEETAVRLRYQGDYNYMLLQSAPQAQTVMAGSGEVVDLGFTLGVLIGDGVKTLHWTLDGVDYRLSSEDLPQEVMVRIAQSVQGQSAK
ncbi:outer membrane lipoprotein carrier protein LolA [Xylanibacillus composti]|uniref:Sporulation protein YdcC n=1 Tax=Xylanibacillus composti TaxID=1572762 RepID=A0A8J4H8Z2_9BACL|nr:outer membrane lipoprotein carrier protein LolA [Xylanibacillus composti]MDT9723719.1 outer membrane lipoprotein carrier protein LolA [Xylanibacillus composti]GIQ71379.1 sporulation protein YdcC [Xylanibacillus composti]